MPNAKRIIYLSDAQRQELFTNGTITVNGVTITYDDNDIYVTPQSEPVSDVQVNGTSVVTGGVANVPLAGYDHHGVVQIANTYGMGITSGGHIFPYSATAADIKAASSGYKVISPNNQHTSAFYALAKAAGDSTQSASSNAVGVYTEDAKSKISDMLNAPVSVSGSTPSITAKSGVRYVCGECATLSFTPSASGDCEVIFESGSTATVLTLPNTVKMPDWFDATSLEANRTYDIIITNGVYGVVTSWA